MGPGAIPWTRSSGENPPSVRLRPARLPTETHAQTTVTVNRSPGCARRWQDQSTGTGRSTPQRGHLEPAVRGDALRMRRPTTTGHARGGQFRQGALGTPLRQQTLVPHFPTGPQASPRPGEAQRAQWEPAHSRRADGPPRGALTGHPGAAGTSRLQMLNSPRTPTGPSPTTAFDLSERQPRPVPRHSLEGLRPGNASSRGAHSGSCAVFKHPQTRFHL